MPTPKQPNKQPSRIRLVDLNYAHMVAVVDDLLWVESLDDIDHEICETARLARLLIESLAKVADVDLHQHTSR